MTADEAVGRGGSTAGTVPWFHRRSDTYATRARHGGPPLPGLGQKGTIALHSMIMTGACSVLLLPSQQLAMFSIFYQK